MNSALALKNKAVSKVLVLYEEEMVLIGDCCVRFDKFRYFRSTLNNAEVHINFGIGSNAWLYDPLLANNPNIDSVFNKAWDEIDFREYDVIFCVSYHEDMLLNYLHDRYGDVIRENELKLPVFSISEVMLNPIANPTCIFPVNKELMECVSTPCPGELYISEAEREWGDSWLESRSVSSGDEVFVIVDSSSYESKVLDDSVHFGFLRYLLTGSRRKLLVFEVGDDNKEEQYRRWLGEDAAARIIVSRKSTLRQNLCLVASKYVKMVFGPCTGIMHCASSIYNHFVNKGMPVEDVPLIVVYTGRLGEKNYPVNSWWGGSPLVKCLLLLDRGGIRELTRLNEIPEKERNLVESLGCNHYNTEMLVEFFNKTYDRFGESNVRDTFRRIAGRPEAEDIERVRRVLILHDEELDSLGDSCVRFDKLRYFRTFLHNATIDINFTHRKSSKYYNGFLKNNPNIDSLTELQWGEIDFAGYDLVFCVSYNEDNLLEFLHENYGMQIHRSCLKLAVYSISEVMLRPRKVCNFIFPVHSRLVEFLKTPKPGELYMKEEEKRWADNWLEHRGVTEADELFIVLDTTKVNSKLLPVRVQLEFMRALLGRERAKVLMFDERNTGKELFYREGLGNKALEKMIFSIPADLRETLCLVASRYVTMIFGPCTGIMHCASGIYNHFLSQGGNPAKVPLMVVYAGKIGRENYNINEWWGNARLIHCLFLIKNGAHKELKVLGDLPPEERETVQSLACTEYNAGLLMDFVTTHLKNH